MNEENSFKLITCYLPKGRGVSMVKLLNEEKGIQTTNVTSGRGTGVAGSAIHDSWIEVDILSVVAGDGKANEIFDFIYKIAKIGEMNNGLIFQSKLIRSIPFKLPEVPEEEQ